MDWLQGITAPLILVGGGAIGWFLKSKLEESRVMRAKLNEDRRKTYSDILVPFVTVLANTKSEDGASEAVRQIMTDLPAFQKNRVDLALFGSDEVVRAHNACWQYAYKIHDGESMEERGLTYLRLWGRLLLEIRKDVGNKDTELDEVDMLRWLISDIDKLEDTRNRVG